MAQYISSGGVQQLDDPRVCFHPTRTGGERRIDYGVAVGDFAVLDRDQQELDSDHHAVSYWLHSVRDADASVMPPKMPLKMNPDDP